MFIEVKNQFIDFHRWENALEEVAFLRNLHRHVFYVTTTISVKEDDREIEFFVLQKKVQEIIKDILIPMPETKSCEQMAKTLIRHLDAKYPNRMITVKVSEDNENSAIVNNILHH